VRPSRRHTYHRRAGGLLVLYTDGLVEALNPVGTEAFGYERLSRLTADGGSPETDYDRILYAFGSTRGVGLRDDLTLMVVAWGSG
jgi:serine phosphatase RsbU (regulator of sigma subunit)